MSTAKRIKVDLTSSRPPSRELALVADLVGAVNSRDFQEIITEHERLECAVIPVLEAFRIIQVAVVQWKVTELAFLCINARLTAFVNAMATAEPNAEPTAEPNAVTSAAAALKPTAAQHKRKRDVDDDGASPQKRRTWDILARIKRSSAVASAVARAPPMISHGVLAKPVKRNIARVMESYACLQFVSPMVVCDLQNDTTINNAELWIDASLHPVNVTISELVETPALLVQFVHVLLTPYPLSSTDTMRDAQFAFRTAMMCYFFPTVAQSVHRFQEMMNKYGKVYNELAAHETACTFSHQAFSPLPPRAVFSITLYHASIPTVTLRPSGTEVRCFSPIT